MTAFAVAVLMEVTAGVIEVVVIVTKQAEGLQANERFLPYGDKKAIFCGR